MKRLRTAAAAVCSCLIFCSLAAAEPPVRLALIGEKNAVDLATAELSKTDAIELLERNGIEKVMREKRLRLLSEYELAQCFPHADAIAVLSKDSLEIFQAKTGVKLANARCDNTSAPDLVRRAVKKLKNPAAMRLAVGFVSVKDVPSAVRPHVGRVIFELEERLLNAENIVLLERIRADAILDEREYSGKTFSPETASRLLRCDFRQGAGPDAVDLTLMLVDASGKELFRREYRAVDGGIKAADDICAFLKTAPPSGVFDRKMEAKRYFDAYYAAARELDPYVGSAPRGFENLRRSVDAAFLLEPENPRYRFEKIFYDCVSFSNYRAVREKRIAALVKFARAARAFHAAYPDFRYPGWSPDDGFSTHPVLQFQPLSTLSSFMPDGTPDAEAAEIDRAIRDLRLLHIAIYKRGKVFGEIRTLRDLQTRCDAIWYRISQPHCDAVEAVREAWSAELEALDLTLAFMKKFPAQAAHAPRDYRYFPGWQSGLCGTWRKKEAWSEVKKLLNEQGPALFQRLNDTKFPPHLHRRIELEGIRDFLNSGGSLEDYENCGKKTFRRLVDEGGLKPQPRCLYLGCLSSAARDYALLPHNRVFPIALDYPPEYMLTRGNLSPAERGAYLAQLADPKVLQNNAALIRSLALEGICSNGLGNAIQAMGYSLYLKKVSDPAAADALSELNSAFEITHFPFPRKVKFCHGATLYQQKLYAVCEDANGMFRLYRYDPETRKTDELPRPGIRMTAFHPGLRGHGQGGVPEVRGEGNLLLIGGIQKVAIFNLEKQSWTLLDELPGGFNAGFAVVGRKLYRLAGGELCDLAPVSIHVSGLDGSGRKCLADGADPRNPAFLPVRGSFSGFFHLPDGRLLFTVSVHDRPGKLIAFDPVSEKFTLLKEMPGSLQFHLRDNGKNLLLQEGPHFGCAFSTLDPAKPDAPVPLLTQRKDDPRNYPHRIDGYDSLCHPAVLAEGRYLVKAGHSYGNWVLDLDAPERSPLLLLPCCVTVFYLPEKQEFLFPAFSQPDAGVYSVKFKSTSRKGTQEK